MLTRLALKIALKKPKIDAFERYLFVGPHPDDIEIGAGATAAKLAAMGKEVCFLICMDGRFGDGHSDGVSGKELAVLRQQEARKSAAMLGVFDVRFLNLRDGNGYKMKKLVKGIAQTVGDFKPDIIFGPDPNSKSESHIDHLNVGDAVRTISCFAPYAGIMMKNYEAGSAPVRAAAYYMTAKPNCFFRTEKKYFQLQNQAIFGCHLSQYPENSRDADALRLYLKLRSIEFGFRSLKGRAEGFRVLTDTEMHCLPETGE